MRLRDVFSRLSLLALAALLANCGGAGGALTPTAPANHTRTAMLARNPFAAPPSGFAGTRAAFQHSLVCDNGMLIANYAKTYGITTIFVPVGGDDIVSLLANNPTTVKNLNAMSAVAKVYMVTGDVSWLSSPTKVPSDVPSLVKIAQMYPQVAGVLYSVDPEASSSWNSSKRQALLQQYFTLIQTLLAVPGRSAFSQIFFLAHPDFATVKYGGQQASPTVLSQLQKPAGITGTVMIVPGNSESTQLANVSTALPQLSKPFWIEASTSKYGGQNYNGVTPAYLQSNLSQLQQVISGQNPLLAGIDVNGWTDLYNSLQTVLPQPPVFTGTLAQGPLVPATGTTYLGGFIDPDGGGSSPQKTAAFEAQIGRNLAYNMHFYGWNGPFPGANEADDIAHGRIPVIAWNCGTTDAQIVSGAADSIIIAHANALKAFGKPIFVRWFWEMNLDDTNNAPRKQCYDPKTDLPSGYFSPTQYIAAWQHIHNIFVQQGATNVIWLWCVANAHGGPAQYYPGDSYVDWVAMDNYDTFDATMFHTFYILSNELAQFQEKPFMITETGAHAALQPTFLGGAAAELQSQFPQARAIGYLDSHGSFQDWVLTADGLASFITFAKDSYMSAMASSP